MNGTALAALPQQQAVACLAVRWNLTKEMARRRWQRERDCMSYSAGDPDMKAAALWYAKHGLPVFPLHWPIAARCSCGKGNCHAPGKHPLTKRGFKDATTDPAVIRGWWTQWPNANIGMPTGTATGTLVVDSDPRNGGPADRSELFERYGPIPDTAEQKTGGGGRHFVFQFSGGAVPKTLAPGIDLKADGGYIVMAPSLHVSGNRYEWDGIEGATALLHPAEIPEWLKERLCTPEPAPRPRPACIPDRISDGTKHNTCVSLAGSMRRRGCNAVEITAALVELSKRFETIVSEAKLRSIAEDICSRYDPAEKNERTSQRTKVEGSPFNVCAAGVFWLKQNSDGTIEAVKLSAPLEVIAKTRDSTGVSWGRLLRWKDDEGRLHKWAMPMDAVASDAGSVRARLLSEGLSFVTTNARHREKLAEYLQTASVEKYVRCVTRVGWHGEAFVLPDANFGPKGSEEVLYQTPNEAIHYWHSNGTPEQWRKHIGSKCSGNSRLIAAASCGFAGPILSLIGAESGGVHFHGATSTGKSTVLLVGGSVCGGGGNGGFVQTWRTTINGLEAIAEAHNDGTLFLDELAQVDAREAAETAYLLGNGQGKTRMTRSIGTHRKLTWTLLYVSAGELTLAEHAASAGKKTRGGAEVRLLNIEADAGRSMGIFEELHGAASPDAFSHALKDAARAYYGSPFRAFIARLTARRADVEKTVRAAREEFIRRFVPSGATGEVKRAADRFALIGAGGELATEWELTGWRKGEANGAAERCLREWLENRGTVGASDMQAALRQVRAFIGTNGTSRFQPIRHSSRAGSDENPEEAQAVRDRAGFRRHNPESGETEYLILPETFRKEVCGGFAPSAVLKELERRELLVRNPPNMTIKPRLPEMGLVRVYCIREAILEDDEC